MHESLVCLRGFRGFVSNSSVAKRKYRYVELQMSPLVSWVVGVISLSLSAFLDTRETRGILLVAHAGCKDVQVRIFYGSPGAKLLPGTSANQPSHE